MAEGPTRRACNRCHAQKLSCKRTGIEACERCVRLGTECKSSLSLRFRRNRLSLDKSQHGDRGSRYSRKVDQGGCLSSDFAAERGGQSALVQGQEWSGGAAAPFMYAATDAMMDRGVFAYSSPVEGHLFGSQPHTDRQPLNIPRGSPVEDIPNLDLPWTPSFQASTVSAEWSQSDSGTSSLHYTTSNDQYSLSSFISCWSPEQFRSDASEHKELADTSREEAKQLQPPPPRQVVLKRVSVNRMAAQGQWLAQLSDINATLWTLTSLVPYLVESGEKGDVYACPSSDRVDEQNPELEEVEGFPIQGMFEASRQLAQVLEEIIRREDIDTRRPEPDELDPGTGLLVLSTYVRLLDLYQKVFRLVQSELAASSPSPTFRLCKMPDVSIGSFPLASALSLQMALTMRLAEDFLSNLRSAMESLGHRLSGTGPSGEQGLWSVVSVSFTAIREREQQISRELVEIREKLETSSTATSPLIVLQQDVVN